jgi:hypothetical protein
MLESEVVLDLLSTTISSPHAAFVCRRKLLVAACLYLMWIRTELKSVEPSSAEGAVIPNLGKVKETQNPPISRLPLQLAF